MRGDNRNGQRSANPKTRRTPRTPIAARAALLTHQTPNQRAADNRAMAAPDCAATGPAPGPLCGTREPWAHDITVADMVATYTIGSV